MVEIVKTYKQSVPALRFIGKKYGDADRVNGTFGAKWDEWFRNGWFDILEKLVDDTKQTYEDGDAYIGLMRWKENEPFEYWMGMFMPINTTVPEEFEYIDFPKKELGVCWIYGKESEVFCQDGKCDKKLEAQGLKMAADEQGAVWWFERYVCPRFTTPDEKGNIILDSCYYI